MQKIHSQTNYISLQISRTIHTEFYHLVDGSVTSKQRRVKEKWCKTPYRCGWEVFYYPNRDKNQYPVYIVHSSTIFLATQLLLFCCQPQFLARKNTDETMISIREIRNSLTKMSVRCGHITFVSILFWKSFRVSFLFLTGRTRGGYEKQHITTI